jgi:ferritin-like metal-binding protein YciE
MKLLLIIYYNTQQQMSLEPDHNNNSSNSSANAIAIVGLNLALSYENAAVDRLEKRVAESIIPEGKEKIKRHLEHTKQQQERLKERIKALGRGMMEPISEKGRLPIPEPPQKLKIMIESNSSDKEREVWESLTDLIIERAEAIMYKGGIQALELLKADKKTIKALEKNLKEEEAFGDWLEKNNPKIAKRLMTKQMQEKKQGKKKTMQGEKEEDAVSATAA